MGTVVNVCVIILTVAIVSIIVVLGIALRDVRRIRSKSESFLDKMEQKLNPILSEIALITGDIRQITNTARCQIEKVDSTADVIGKNVNSIVERWMRTVNLLNDAVVEPVEDMALFLKGFSRGLKYFFGDNRDSKNSR
ncbi:MAG: DUF948 domain-containing protein [Deltaproteobacteria bacterium]|nr:DUF948 domain-containing protein [Deltaproteobacteria bacterium]